MNNKMTFEDKMIALKRMHKDSNHDSLRKIKEWESRMGNLEVQRDWLAHPNTQELRDIALNQTQAIKHELSTNRDLTNERREGLFEAQELHLAYLAVLTVDPASEISSLESEVDFEL